MRGTRSRARSLYVVAIVLLGTLTMMLSGFASQAQMSPRYNSHSRNW